MTQVMRAARAPGRKLLRVAVVHRGRIVDERLFENFEEISVGPNEACTFVLPSTQLRSRHRLFETDAKGSFVLFNDEMRGRVALPDGVTELEVLRNRLSRGAKGVYRQPLSEESRGRIVIAETSILFQFVEPVPVHRRAQLPAAITRGAGGIDWRTTIIAAFAFFVHFMAVGSMYSEWLDPVVDEQISLANLMDRIDKLPPPPAPEEKPAEEQDSKEAEPVEEKQAEKKPLPSEKIPDQPGAPLSQAQAAALSNELEQLSMMTLGALGSTGPATAGVLQSGNLPTGALDAAAASGSGVGIGQDLNIGGRGGPVQPGSGQALGTIGATSKSSSEAGAAKEVKGPVGSSSFSSQVAVGTVSNASRVIAAANSGFRRCYQRGLDLDPNISGSIRLTISVGPGGEVSSVTASSTGSIPPSVLECVKSRARTAQFAPPDGGSAVINVPISFVKQ